MAHSSPPAPQIEFLISPDRCGRSIVEASGALRDQVRVGQLHVTTDAAERRDDSTLWVPPGAVSQADGPAADYERVYERLRQDVDVLLDRCAKRGEDMHEVRLFLVACAGELRRPGLLFLVLLAGQQLQAELANLDVWLSRYVLLALPPPVQGKPLPDHRRAAAIVVGLQAAAGGVLIGDARLDPPLAEGIVVVEPPRLSRPGMETRAQHGGQILRVLADQGPLCDHVRRLVRQAAGSDQSGPGIFRLVDTAAIRIEREPIAAWLAGLLLDLDARARAGRRDEGDKERIG